MKLFAFGYGVGTRNAKGEWLEVYFPAPWLAEGAPAKSMSVAAPSTGAAGARDAMKRAATLLGYKSGNVAMAVTPGQAKELAAFGGAFAALAEATKPLVAVFLDADVAPTTVPEAYLKLHILSHRLTRPHGVNLQGIFKVLPNVAWTNRGPIDVEELPALQAAARAKGEHLEVNAVDKFPKLVDYVVPSGVRIADAARVRLGAYLGPGTTVMHEGFLNYNAGTEGPNMVEGRISAGVFVQEGSDIGGGASTMGTLSGGGDVVITVGKNCLLGANAGLGIPLGDDCTVEAGLYLTAASKVRVLDRDKKAVRIVKAKELAGRSNLLFRRNSQDGAIECLANKAAIALNDDLHSNN